MDQGAVGVLQGRLNRPWYDLVANRACMVEIHAQATPEPERHFSDIAQCLSLAYFRGKTPNFKADRFAGRPAGTCCARCPGGTKVEHLAAIDPWVRRLSAGAIYRHRGEPAQKDRRTR